MKLVIISEKPKQVPRRRHEHILFSYTLGLEDALSKDVNTTGGVTVNEENEIATICPFSLDKCP